YRDLWAGFMQTGRARLWLAEHEGDLLAGVMTFEFGARAWYMYGASTSEKRQLMPNYLLQWEAIRQARAGGARVYDFWGAPDRLEESDPMWGVYRFKAGFGGRLACWVGAYDFAVHRPLYLLYTQVMPRVLDVMRARRGRPE
ncbi:MAG: peptidoglycan bridge formation glycyltransferase FemA/FemB family protein, partial [Chloroflexi bacterium]|nr:peptidoglycan bridge formation glycyltransferase FemA/FemB family protein [Chloroflexota bacterium]